MKAKIKFDKAKAQQFLLIHGEKILFGIFIAIFALLAYSAMNVERYDKTPDQLTVDAKNLSDRITASKPGRDLDQELAHPDLTAVSSGVVDPNSFRIRVFRRPFNENKVPRGAPRLLPPTDLMAFSGHGGLWMGNRQSSGGGAMGGGAMGGGNMPGGGAGGGNMPGGGAGGNMPGGGAGGNMPGGAGGDMQGGGAGGNMPGGAGGNMPGGAGGGMQGGGAGGNMPGGAGGGMQGGGAGGNMPGGAGGGKMGGMAGGGGGNMPGMKGGRDKDKDKKAKKPKKVEAPPDLYADAEKPLISIPSDVKPIGKHWVCVPALVPVLSQASEYTLVFQNSVRPNPDTDRPEYRTYDVERAEVPRQGASAELTWEQVDVDAQYNFLQGRAVDYPEVVREEYIDPAFCDALPPLVGRKHNVDEVRHPKIPLAAQFDPAASLAPAQQVEPADKGAPAERVFRGAKVRGAQGNAAPGGAANMPGGANSRGRGAPATRVEQKLFRFFDFSVDPGKTYRYRVRLHLVNPNFGVERRYLQDPAFAEGKTLATDWSEPSPPVYVPHGSHLMAGIGKPATTMAETTVQMLCRQFLPAQGVDAVVKFAAQPGMMASFPQHEVLLPDPSKPGSARKEKVDFLTDILFVDIDVAQTVPSDQPELKRIRPPSRVLLLGPDGELSLIDQFADASSFQREEKLLEYLESNANSKDKSKSGKSDGENDFGLKGLLPSSGKGKKSKKR